MIRYAVGNDDACQSMAIFESPRTYISYTIGDSDTCKAAAVEGAAEGFLLFRARYNAHLLSHADVGCQLHKLAAVAVAAANVTGERVPIALTVDDDGIVCRITCVCPRPLHNCAEQGNH